MKPDTQMMFTAHMDQEDREERVKSSFAALGSVEHSAAEKVSDDLRAVSGVLKKANEDILLDHPRRGAVWEYAHVLSQLNKLDKHVKVKDLVPAIDSRAHKDKQALEKWREAECLALHPHSFSALRQLPELQQIIAHTAVSAIHACAGKLDHLQLASSSEKEAQHLAAAELDPGLLKHAAVKKLKDYSDQLGPPPADGLFSAVCCASERVKVLDPERCSLLDQLAPGLRLCLAAEVAVGMLCPSQPPPPDTPEHAAALQMFVAEAEKHISAELDEWSFSMLERVGPEYNAVEGIEEMWRHMSMRDVHAKLPKLSQLPAWALSPHLDLQLQLPPQQVLEMLCWVFDGCCSTESLPHEAAADQQQHNAPLRHEAAANEQQQYPSLQHEAAADQQQQHVLLRHEKPADQQQQQHEQQLAMATLAFNPNQDSSCDGSSSNAIFEQLPAARVAAAQAAAVNIGEGSSGNTQRHAPCELQPSAVPAHTHCVSAGGCYTLPFSKEGLHLVEKLGLQTALEGVWPRLLAYAHGSSGSCSSLSPVWGLARCGAGGRCAMQQDANAAATHRQQQQQQHAQIAQSLMKLTGVADDRTSEATKQAASDACLCSAFMDCAVLLVLSFIDQQWSHGANSLAWQQAVPLQTVVLCALLIQTQGLVERVRFEVSSLNMPEQCSLQVRDSSSSSGVGSNSSSGSKALQQQSGSAELHTHVAAQRPSLALQRVVSKVVGMVQLMREFKQANEALNAAAPPSPAAVAGEADQGRSKATSSSSRTAIAPDVFFSSQGPLAPGIWGLTEPAGFGLWSEMTTLKPTGSSHRSAEASCSNGKLRHGGNSGAATAAAAWQGRGHSSSSPLALQQEQQQLSEDGDVLEKVWRVFFATGFWQHTINSIDTELQRQLAHPAFAACAAASSQAAALAQLARASSWEHSEDEVALLQEEVQQQLANFGLNNPVSDVAEGVKADMVSEAVADQLIESKLSLLQAFGLMGPLRRRFKTQHEQKRKSKVVGGLSIQQKRLGGLQGSVLNFGVTQLDDDDYAISSDDGEEQLGGSSSNGGWQRQQQRRRPLGLDAGIEISSDEDDEYDYNLGNHFAGFAPDDPELNDLDDLGFGSESDSDPEMAALKREYWQVHKKQTASLRQLRELQGEQQQQPYGAYSSNNSSRRHRRNRRDLYRKRTEPVRLRPQGCGHEWAQHAAAVAAEAAGTAETVTGLAKDERRECLMHAQDSYRDLATTVSQLLTPLWRWHVDWLRQYKQQTRDAQDWWKSPIRSLSAAQGRTATGHQACRVQQMMAALKSGREACSSSSSSNGVWRKGKHDHNIHCPLCRNDICSLAQPSCSSSSVYSSPAVPYTDPFMWRRLLWQLLGKLSPEAQAFYAHYLAVCPHCSEKSVWHCISLSIQAALWSPQTCDAVDMQLAAPVTGTGADTRPVRIMQLARALNTGYVKGARHMPGSVVLAQQLLLSLSPLHQQLLPGPEVALLCPSSFPAAIGKVLMSHLVSRPHLDLLQHEHVHLHMWHVWWHVGVRRYAMLKQQQQQEGEQDAALREEQQQEQSLDDLYLDADARVYAVSFAARQLSNVSLTSSAALVDTASPATLAKAREVTNSLKADALLGCIGHARPDAHLAGPDRHQAGPDAHQAGPDGYQAGPDRHQAGPDAHQAGPDGYQAGPDRHQAGLDVDPALLHALNLLDETDADHLNDAATPVWDMLAPAAVRSHDCSRVLPTRLVQQYYSEVSLEAADVVRADDALHQQQQQGQQQQQQAQENGGCLNGRAAVDLGEDLTQLGDVALLPPAPLDALVPVDIWWARQQQLLGLDRMCDICGDPAVNGLLCEGCGSALYCSDWCKHRDEAQHAAVCGKLAAAAKRYAGPPSAPASGNISRSGAGPFPLLSKLLQPQLDEPAVLGMDCWGGSGFEQHTVLPRAVYIHQASALLARLDQARLFGRDLS